MKDDFQDSIENDRAVIAKKGGETIGMLRFFEVNSTEHGRIFEIGRIFTTQSERGEGVFRNIFNQALDRINEIDPEAAVLIGTKEEPVKAFCRKLGWKEIGFEKYMRIHGVVLDDDNREQVVKEGWTAFLKHPEVAYEPIG